MPDLKTTCMGVALENPFVIGACSLSSRVDRIKQLEDAGAGALVIKSLFEEQVQLERKELDDMLSQSENVFAEALSMFPQQDHAGAAEHLYWIKETRKAVKMPLFASLNAVNKETWVEYSKALEETGVNGLELNFYSPPMDAAVSAADIEKQEIDILASVVATVKIPVAVKLHPYYTSLLNHARNLDQAGAKAMVIFNRLFEPDVDVATETKKGKAHLSTPADNRVSLRWTALLSTHCGADIVSNTGIMSGKDAAKMILAGAKAVQVVSAIYGNGIGHVTKMRADLEAWMKEHNYTSIEQCRGKVAKFSASDLWHFERGQYIKGLLGFD